MDADRFETVLRDYVIMRQPPDADWPEAHERIMAGVAAADAARKARMRRVQWVSRVSALAAAVALAIVPAWLVSPDVGVRTIMPAAGRDTAPPTERDAAFVVSLAEAGYPMRLWLRSEYFASVIGIHAPSRRFSLLRFADDSLSRKIKLGADLEGIPVVDETVGAWTHVVVLLRPELLTEDGAGATPAAMPGQARPAPAEDLEALRKEIGRKLGGRAILIAIPPAKAPAAKPGG